MIYVKIGTGIGAGLVSGGQVHRGANGCAGDIGHVSVAEAGDVSAAAATSGVSRPLPAVRPSPVKDVGWPSPAAAAAWPMSSRRDRRCVRYINPRPQTLPRSWRGVPLAARAATFEENLQQLDGLLDRGQALDVAPCDSSAQPWHGPPVWIRRRPHPGNLLVIHGRLSAVI